MSASTSALRVRAVLSSRRVRLAIRVLVGAGVLFAVVARVGSEPFVRGVSSIDPPVIAATFALSAAATAAAAWRWTIIAGRLGMGLRFREAVGMYYRSQFLNTVLPGGVVGDVQRALSQGRDAGDVAQAARAVVIERTMGQLVQGALAVIVLVSFGPEFAGYLLPALAIGVTAIVVAGLVATAASARVRSALRREFDELSAGVGSPGAFVWVVVASIVVVACHVVTFGVAVGAVGASVPPLRIAVIALVVLLAGSIPLNIGGWGPREGIAGWAFAVAGLGASTGVAASALFGVAAMIAVAPGLVLAATSAARRGRTPPVVRAVVLADALHGEGS
jgi:glycosyltransferase 2 family protein